MFILNINVAALVFVKFFRHSNSLSLGRASAPREISSEQIVYQTYA